MKDVYTYGTVLAKSASRRLLVLLQSKAMPYITILIVAISVVYTVSFATLSQETTGDQFVLTHAVESISPGSPIILLAQHTNLIKLPLLWAQAHSSYNTASWIALNVALVMGTILLWSYVCSRAARNIHAFSLSNVFLSSMLLASTAFATALSMSAQRNIEYALLALFLYLLYQRSMSKRLFIVTSAILALLVASDYYFLVIVPTSVAVLACLSILLKGRKAMAVEALRIAPAFLGAIMGMALLKLLNFLQLFEFFRSVHGARAFHSVTPSLKNILVEQPPVLATQILKLTGGNIFEVSYSKSLILMLLFFGVTIYMFCILARRFKKDVAKKDLSFSSVLLMVLIVVLGAYTANSLADPGDANIRFISIVPFVLTAGILLQSYNRKKYILLFTLSIVTFLAGLLLAIGPNRHFYIAKKTHNDQTVREAEDIADALMQEKTRVAYGTISWAPVVWFHSNTEIDAYVISPCHKARQPISNAAWFNESDQSRSALIVDRRMPSYAVGESWHECSNEQIRKIYGEPYKIVLQKNDTTNTELWFFDYNINSRFVRD